MHITVCRMRISSRFLTRLPAMLGLGLMVASAKTVEPPAVPTAREPVTNVYHGVVVVDDYQWLENRSEELV